MKTKLDGRFMCIKCGRRFSEQTPFSHHKDACNQPDILPYKCEVCERRFLLQATLTRHLRRHTGEKPYKCSYCEKTFADSGDRKRHESRHPGVSERHTCIYPMCEKSFATTNDLKCHLRRHQGEKLHSCDQCPERFTEVGNLTKHKTKHSTERRHKCHLCSKTYKRRHHLREHLRSRFHANEQPYPCTKCDKRFPSRDTLRSDLLIHEREKPFQCESCNFACADRSNFSKHRKKYNGHNAKPQPAYAPLTASVAAEIGSVLDPQLLSSYHAEGPLV